MGICPDGTVASATMIESSFSDEINACVERKFVGVKVPPFEPDRSAKPYVAARRVVWLK